MYVIPLSPSEQTSEFEKESVLLMKYLKTEKNRSTVATESGFVDDVLESFTPTKTHIEYIIESEEGFHVQSPSIDGKFFWTAAMTSIILSCIRPAAFLILNAPKLRVWVK